MDYILGEGPGGLTSIDASGGSGNFSFDAQKILTITADTDNRGIRALVGSFAVVIPVELDIITAVEILWNSVSGAVYEVQYSDHLVSTNWLILEEVIGTGGTNSVFDSTIGVIDRSYRTLQAP